jgi:hypothetical protein
VKIKGTCNRDGRSFMAEQAIASGGACPWDGEPFRADYAVTLVNALRDAEEAGSKLELALAQLADLRPEFNLEADSLIGPLQSQLTRLEQNLIAQG